MCVGVCSSGADSEDCYSAGILIFFGGDSNGAIVEDPEVDCHDWQW